MSLFNWLFPARKAHRGQPAAESSGLSRMEATRPVGRRETKDSSPQPNSQPANRKGERMARRELLYTVVRESMTRAGVLSSSYKFKVLSLDARGRQFLVMVDLAREYGGETASLAEIEALVAQAAKSRYDIVVTSVYWRMNEHVAVGLPGPRTQKGSPSRPMPLESRPGGLDSLPAVLDSGPLPLPLTSQPAPLTSRPSPLTSRPAPLAAQPAVAAQRPAAQRAPARFEPIEADEVAAFKQALAVGVAKPPAATPATPAKVAPSQKGEAALAAAAAAGGAHAKGFDGSSKHGPQSYTLLTGFEDTEMPEQEPARSPAALSGTQYGELN